MTVISGPTDPASVFKAAASSHHLPLWAGWMRSWNLQDSSRHVRGRVLSKKKTQRLSNFLLTSVAHGWILRTSHELSLQRFIF